MRNNYDRDNEEEEGIEGIERGGEGNEDEEDVVGVERGGEDDEEEDGVVGVEMGGEDEDKNEDDEDEVQPAHDSIYEAEGEQSSVQKSQKEFRYAPDEEELEQFKNNPESSDEEVEVV